MSRHYGEELDRWDDERDERFQAVDRVNVAEAGIAAMLSRVTELEIAVKILQDDVKLIRTRGCCCEKH